VRKKNFSYLVFFKKKASKKKKKKDGKFFLRLGLI